MTFEWALIRDQTDTPQTAHELGTLLSQARLLCHVNVIPLNPTGGFNGKPTSKAGVDEFIRILDGYGISATPRTRRGIDIDAGCGQLKAELLRKRKGAVGVKGIEGLEGLEGLEEVNEGVDASVVVVGGMEAVERQVKDSEEEREEEVEEEEEKPMEQRMEEAARERELLYQQMAEERR